MTSGGTAKARIIRFDPRRMILTWAVMLAFALQGFVTQTHIHPGQTARVAEAGAAGATSLPLSPNQEEAICPLCQATAAAGAYVGPAPIAVAVPPARLLSASREPIVLNLAGSASSFSWRSRAPPTL